MTNDLDEEVRRCTYISHGHASTVLILEGDRDYKAILEALEPHVSGFESWQVSDGKVDSASIDWHEPHRASERRVADISCERLGFESAAQVRQFNANIALLTRIVETYAPEIWPLIQSLHVQVSQIADRLRSDPAIPLEQSSRVSSETVLIETNAVVTLYCSQLGSGTFPIHRSTFPVGEYSLLGIGAMCRAAWRLYEHLNQTFAQFDHPTSVRDLYPKLPAFDPFGPSSTRQDFSTWRQTNFALHQLPATAKPIEPRYHVPYFSSRWGFHESLHAISLSWQCLYASATKEWNLLTVTHEFLHAQVRAIFAEIMKPRHEDGDLATAITDRFNAQSGGTNARESMQVAYVEALVVFRAATTLSRSVGSPGAPNRESISKRISPETLHDLVREYTGIIHEVIVHVLDFRYVYAGRDLEYLQSIWCSWSLVPGVSDQIEHYVMRTLAALSAVTDLPESASNADRFRDARDRLCTTLKDLCESDTARPALAEALSVLEDNLACKRLAVQFNVLRYVVELAQTFLYDERLNTALMADSQTDSDEVTGRFVYDVEPGRYDGRRAESPVGFLLDQFPKYSDRAGSDEAEFDSIWQMLHLI